MSGKFPVDGVQVRVFTGGSVTVARGDDRCDVAVVSTARATRTNKETSGAVVMKPV